MKQAPAPFEKDETIKIKSTAPKQSQFLVVLSFLIALSSIGLSLYLFQEWRNTKNLVTSGTPTIQAIPSTKSQVEDVQDLNKRMVTIAAAVQPTVVTVLTERRRAPVSDQFEDSFVPSPNLWRRRGLGSGVIVDPKGYILTNNHVVYGATSVSVLLPDGQHLEAKIVGSDPKTDIAVLNVEAKNLKAIEVGNSEKLQVGEIVLAIGSPMSPNLAATVTQGIVSAKGRSNVGLADYEDFIQTDAAINPGNSGGPLVNLDGELVGINTAIASQSGGSQGIGFAVPINMAKVVQQSIIKNGKVVRGWLGVTMQDLTPNLAEALGLTSSDGALLSQVSPGGPAEKSGLHQGDIVTEVNKKSVKHTTQLRNLIVLSAPGTTFSFTVIREGKTVPLTVKTGEQPSIRPEEAQASIPNYQEIFSKLGFQLIDQTPELVSRYGLEPNIPGVVVISIAEGSSASRAGLEVGDVIQAIARRPTPTVRSFVDVYQKLKSKDPLLFQLRRGGRAFFVAFTP